MFQVYKKVIQLYNKVIQLYMNTYVYMVFLRFFSL